MTNKTDDIDLFAQANAAKRASVRSLLTLYSDHDEPLTQRDMSADDIFAYQQFDHFIGVTYSLSPYFVNKYLAHFAQATLVVGLPQLQTLAAVKSQVDAANDAVIEAHIREAVQSRMHNQAVAAQLCQFKETALRQVDKQALQLLVPYDCVIHSKFYLLWDSKTKANRVISGSANFSQPAFATDNAQFEVVTVNDNTKQFALYQQYYEQLKQVADLHPYLTKTMLADVKQHLQQHPQQALAINLDINTTSGRQALTDIVKNYTDSLRNDVASSDSPATTMTINVMHDDATVDTQCQQLASQQAAVKFDKGIIVRSITKRGKTDAHVAAPATITKKIATFLHTSGANKQPQASLLNDRLVLTYDDIVHSDIDSGLTRGSIDGSTTRLGTVINDDMLKRSLAFFDHLMASFQHNPLGRYNDAYGQRIFEFILSAFTAPFISVIAQHITHENIKTSLPSFVILAGVGGSGKTSLLRIATMLTGLPYRYCEDGKALSAVGYETLRQQLVQRHINSYYQALTTQLIDEMSSSDVPASMSININPLKIDDIAESYFENSNYRFETLVKSVANTNATHATRRLYPVMLATTNTHSLNANQQLGRRIMYLEMSQAFPNSTTNNSSTTAVKHSNAVLAQLEAEAAELGDTLFQDFARRFNQQYLHNDKLNFDNIFSSGDSLIITRKIFADYYREAGRSLPAFFPAHAINDIAMRERNLWQQLFATHRDYFKFSTDYQRMYVDLSQVVANESTYNKGAMISKYVNSLPANILSDSIGNSHNIGLAVKPFLAWLGISAATLPCLNKVTKHYQLTVLTKTVRGETKQQRYDFANHADLQAALLSLQANRHGLLKNNTSFMFNHQQINVKHYVGSFDSSYQK